MKRYSFILLSVCLLLITGCVNAGKAEAQLAESREIPLPDITGTSIFEYRWRHGTASCGVNAEPTLEIFQYNSSSFILRQSKCSSFEAPFMYLFMGSNKAVLIDTGDAEHSSTVPLAPTIDRLLNRYYGESDDPPALLIVHSHSHSDHIAGDSQFTNRANTTIIGTQQQDIQSFFQFNSEGMAKVSLGDRELSVLFTPGHQEEAISIYDSKTQWLLTGDTFYPGLIYVKHWQTFQQSIAKIVNFGESHSITAILGGHIEMRHDTGEIYAIGSTYQPNERSLALSFAQLQQLNTALQQADEPIEIKQRAVIVMPLSSTQRTLSNLFRWLFS